MLASLEGSKKQLKSKANFTPSFQLNCSNFRLKQCKNIRVTEIAKEIKFKRVWGNLESKKGFQRQPITKYLRLTLVFV